MNRQYKLSIFFALYLISICVSAQQGRLGIGTENPTRTLHVQGDAQIKGLQSTTSGAYSEVLITDDEGNLEYTNLWTVNPTRKRVWHLQYSTSGSIQQATTANILDTGRFRFRMEGGTSDNNNSGRIQLSLSSNPGQTVTVYLNYEENYQYNTDPDGFQFNSSPNGIVFTTSDWNTWKYPTSGGASQAAVLVGEMNEMFISYPGENAFYRVLVYRMSTGTNTSTWIITAEEFGS